MKILLVVDQFDLASNGTAISTRRFAVELQRRGNEVRVLTTASDAPPAELEAQDGIRRYLVPQLSLPGVNGIIRKQQVTLGRPVRPIIVEAVQWAEVVHVTTPFWLGPAAGKAARELGVPATGAFHCQAENITYNLGMGRFAPANWLVYAIQKRIWDKFGHVHCPSSFIAGELRRNRYRSKLHVVSNGVGPDFIYRKLPKSPELDGSFVITMIGRLSPEKRQDVLIEAVKRSRYSDRIQIMLAGTGPRRERLAKRGASLARPPIIDFYSEQRLQQVLAMSDLYVHASDIEIEAISCIEAFASGLVPVIANSKKSATPQFALDERSLFAAGKPADLAAKIDYWIENSGERRRMEARYAEAGLAYGLGRCVEQIENMFREAISDG
ncbi:MAG: glycosyltransferase [Promicromonosporaceae bacterium]|nr:glycosyltransferase [Promicromonosporaceae bacterium]